MARLCAVLAVLGTAAGLDAQERAELHFLIRVVRAMDGARLVEEREERAVVELPDDLRCVSMGRFLGADSSRRRPTGDGCLGLVVAGRAGGA